MESDLQAIQAISTAPLETAEPPGDAGLASGRSEVLWPPFDELDRMIHAWQGHLTGGASPLALSAGINDWALHLWNAPFRRAQLALAAASLLLRLPSIAAGATAVEPGSSDHRFLHEGWRRLPFHFWQQAFLLAEEWADEATRGLPGVANTNERLVNFAARQWLDIFSPSNLPWANPEIIEKTTAANGDNLLAGWRLFLKDVMSGEGLPAHNGLLQVGRDLAVTPGKVILRDPLFELIEYAPVTNKVRAEPILIVPAWIMKYYILDLSPGNSLIRYLTQQGHTVFCMSWRNPDATMRDVGFDDYRLSVLAALDAVSGIVPGAKIHAAGYCLGGTLLSVAASAMARDGDDRLASVTLFAAQTDFTDAGELQLFISEDQLAFLEDVMMTQGYLDKWQMSGSFRLLHSRDLIWSRLIRNYWLGEEEHPNDLMAWNADATRMPARMHSEYLSHFFLRNDFAEGRLAAGGQPVALSDLRLPLFVVSTETDHIAPWRSVYKLHLLNPSEITFVLTSGGHNAGIVSEPGHPHRHFRMHERKAAAPYIGPDAWTAAAERREGSWWPAWAAWLAQRSSAMDRNPPPMGSNAFPALADAPGSYVIEQ
jgi:polyhydroxyalkanoate synthase